MGKCWMQVMVTLEPYQPRVHWYAFPDALQHRPNHVLKRAYVIKSIFGIQILVRYVCLFTNWFVQDIVNTFHSYMSQVPVTIWT
jgi:hypothetical protein